MSQGEVGTLQGSTVNVYKEFCKILQDNGTSLGGNFIGFEDCILKKKEETTG